MRWRSCLQHLQTASVGAGNRHMATIHGYIPQYKAYPERYDKYFKEKDGRSKVKVVGGEKITAKFRVLPPQDPVLREKYVSFLFILS